MCGGGTVLITGGTGMAGSAVAGMWLPPWGAACGVVEPSRC
ncbi:hypothetical protein I553_3972 [Mycobacterium xenopi 4042]|uniref:Uncharacterized protein n=1 Tax=Mycobacterium xenopi 4042 TaxID=1299334 RepID=X7Z030_MYCXE|nr:hypothetical protein I553_3972 [Mycobacterium xenopi 4042]